MICIYRIIIIQSRIIFSNSRTAASTYNLKIWIDPPVHHIPHGNSGDNDSLWNSDCLKKAPGIFWSIRHAWKHLARDGLVTSWRQRENWTNLDKPRNHGQLVVCIKDLPANTYAAKIYIWPWRKLGQFHPIRSTISFDPSIDLQVSSPYQAKWIEYDRKQRRGTLHIVA